MKIQDVANFDKQLAELYSTKVTVNLEQESTLSPNEFWNSMEMIAGNYKAMLNFDKAK